MCCGRIVCQRRVVVHVRDVCRGVAHRLNHVDQAGLAAREAVGAAEYVIAVGEKTGDVRGGIRRHV